MLVTIAEAARRLKISKSAIQKRIDRGDLQIKGWRKIRGGKTALIDPGKCGQVRTKEQERELRKIQSSHEVIWLSADKCAELIGITVRGVRMRARREGWPVKKSDTEMNGESSHQHGGPPKQGYFVYPLSSLPSEARHRYLEEHKARILRMAAPSPPGIEALTEIPPGQAEAAVRRLRFVHEAMEIQKTMPSEWKRRGISRQDALGKIARQAGITYPTLLGWVRSYIKEGISGLVPKERGHQAATLDDITKRMAFTIYADRQQPSYQQAYTTIIKKCREQNITIPSYAAVYRFLKGMPPAAIDYWRRGGTYIRKHYVPPILRLLDDLAINECWMGDATTLDCFCLYPKRPNPVRPTLTAWMDIKSRLVVGYIVAPTVNTNTVALGFRDAALHYGLPEVVYVDNGKEYKNKNWRGQIVSYGQLEVVHIKGRWERLGILPMFAWPYNPQSKAQVERWFNTLSHSFLNLLPGYSGANITAKTKRKDQERLSQEIKQGALLSFDELTVAVGEAVEAYNHKSHKALNGKSPAQAFEEGYRQPRLVTERALDFCQAKQRVAIIKSGGITVRETGVTYISHDPSYIRSIGRKGVLRYDPRDVSQAHLSAIVNGREIYCCALAPREGVAFRASEADLKEAISRKKRTYKLIAEASRAMKIKAIDVRAELQEANFAVDPGEREAFQRGIAIKRGEGNVIQLVSDVPAREEEGQKKLVGLFDD